MRRFAILASVMTMALGSAYCSGSSGNIVAPSAVDASAAATDARSGGGGGKGGGGTTGGSSSLTLVMWNDVNGDGAPNYNDTVTFNVSTTQTTAPIVAVDCYQGGTKVYWTQAAFYDGDPWPWTKYMLLQSTYWTGGAANCVANLQYQTNRGNVTIKSISFDVAP